MTRLMELKVEIQLLRSHVRGRKVSFNNNLTIDRNGESSGLSWKGRYNG